jgi:hypothetical protein
VFGYAVGGFEIKAKVHFEVEAIESSTIRWYAIPQPR